MLYPPLLLKCIFLPSVVSTLTLCAATVTWLGCLHGYGSGQLWASTLSVALLPHWGASTWPSCVKVTLPAQVQEPGDTWGFDPNADDDAMCEKKFSSLFLGHSGSAFVQPCSLASGSCPPMCSCSNNIVDCRGRGLTAIPAHLPEGMTEMWVSHKNYIEWYMNDKFCYFVAL